MKRNIQRVLLLAVLLLGPGCVSTQPWISNFQETPALPAYVWCLWDARVHETQDVVNGGRSLPGLAGRLYVCDPDFKPMDKSFLEKGDAKLNVELFDISNATPGAEPVRLGGWQLDGPTLVKFLRKDDKVGWGYTLFMPWPDYRPDIKRVEITVCFTPAHGSPMYASPTPMSLRNEISSTRTQKVVGQFTPTMAK